MGRRGRSQRQVPEVGTREAARDVEAVVDTGYSGFLTLPVTLVAELRLPFAYVGWALLANDDEVSFDAHDVTVLWDANTGLSRPMRRAAPRPWVWNCLAATT